MPRVLVLSGPNHGFDQCAPIVADALKRDADFDVTLSEDKSILVDGLGAYDVVVLGTGFTTMQRQPDGTNKRVPDLTPGAAAGALRVRALWRRSRRRPRHRLVDRRRGGQARRRARELASGGLSSQSR